MRSWLQLLAVILGCWIAASAEDQDEGPVAEGEVVRDWTEYYRDQFNKDGSYKGRATKQSKAPTKDIDGQYPPRTAFGFPRHRFTMEPITTKEELKSLQDEVVKEFGESRETLMKQQQQNHEDGTGIGSFEFDDNGFPVIKNPQHVVTDPNTGQSYAYDLVDADGASPASGFQQTFEVDVDENGAIPPEVLNQRIQEILAKQQAQQGQPHEGGAGLNLEFNGLGGLNIHGGGGNIIFNDVTINGVHINGQFGGGVDNSFANPPLAPPEDPIFGPELPKMGEFEISQMSPSGDRPTPSSYELPSAEEREQRRQERDEQRLAAEAERERAQTIAEEKERAANADALSRALNSPINQAGYQELSKASKTQLGQRIEAINMAFHARNSDVLNSITGNLLEDLCDHFLTFKPSTAWSSLIESRSTNSEDIPTFKQEKTTVADYLGVIMRSSDASEENSAESESQDLQPKLVQLSMFLKREWNRCFDSNSAQSPMESFLSRNPALAPERRAVGRFFYFLSLSHEVGLLVGPPNPATALLYLRKAGKDFGDVTALATLGMKYELGYGVPQSCSRSAHAYIRGALSALRRSYTTVTEEGQVEKFRVSPGMTYLRGRRANPIPSFAHVPGGDSDGDGSGDAISPHLQGFLTEDVMHYQQHLAERGDPGLQLLLGYATMHGTCFMSKSYRQAKSYFLSSLASRTYDALVGLGLLASHTFYGSDGNIVKRANFTDSLRYFSLAATLQLPSGASDEAVEGRARKLLEQMIRVLNDEDDEDSEEKGAGDVPAAEAEVPNRASAAPLSAAPEALNGVGYILYNNLVESDVEDSIGMPRSRSEAKDLAYQYFFAAARMGNRNALYNLALMFHLGEVSDNDIEANQPIFPHVAISRQHQGLLRQIHALASSGKLVSQNQIYIVLMDQAQTAGHPLAALYLADYFRTRFLPKARSTKEDTHCRLAVHYAKKAIGNAGLDSRRVEQMRYLIQTLDSHRVGSEPTGHRPFHQFFAATDDAEEKSFRATALENGNIVDALFRLGSGSPDSDRLHDVAHRIASAEVVGLAFIPTLRDDDGWPELSTAHRRSVENLLLFLGHHQRFPFPSSEDVVTLRLASPEEEQNIRTKVFLRFASMFSAQPRIASEVMSSSISEPIRALALRLMGDAYFARWEHERQKEGAAAAVDDDQDSEPTSPVESSVPSRELRLALRLYAQGAEIGDAECLYNLGHALEYGFVNTLADILPTAVTPIPIPTDADVDPATAGSIADAPHAQVPALPSLIHATAKDPLYPMLQAAKPIVSRWMLLNSEKVLDTPYFRELITVALALEKRSANAEITTDEQAQVSAKIHALLTEPLGKHERLLFAIAIYEQLVTNSYPASTGADGEVDQAEPSNWMSSSSVGFAPGVVAFLRAGAKYYWSLLVESLFGHF